MSASLHAGPEVKKLLDSLSKVLKQFRTGVSEVKKLFDSLSTVLKPFRSGLSKMKTSLTGTKSGDVADVRQDVDAEKGEGQLTSLRFGIHTPMGESPPTETEAITPVVSPGSQNPQLNQLDQEEAETAPQGRQQVREEPNPKITIIRDFDTAAPNISLNSHSVTNRLEIYVVAVLGTLVQLGVLVFFGLMTYYQPLKPRFKKDDKAVAWYGFPAAAGGTLVLALGLFICAAVVEQRTEEKHYRTAQKHNVRVVWLQQEATVSDQVFHSFAIYPKNELGDRNLFTTSRQKNEGTDQAHEQPKTTISARFEAIVKSMETLTTIGTFISLLGFVFQFTGLRAMNWTASVVQLGAVVLMTFFRSSIRRGFAKAPESTPLTPEFELDWFALTLANPKDEPWMKPRGKGPQNGKPKKAKAHDASWTIATGGQQEYMALEKGVPGTGGESTAQRTMKFRTDLGTLAGWRGPAQAEAVQLSLAMEAVMDALLARTAEADNQPKRYVWTLPVQNCMTSQQETPQKETSQEKTSQQEKLSIGLKFEEGRWRVDAREIDAVLSLWLYCVRSQQQSKGSDKEKIETTDTKFRAKGEREIGFRLLGPSSKKRALLRELHWWMPDRAPEVLEAVTTHAGGSTSHFSKTWKVPNERIVGCGTTNPTYESSQTDFHYRSAQLASEDKELEALEPVFAVECFDSLEKLYSRDLFFAFVRAIARLPQVEFKESSTISASSNNEERWLRLKFQHKDLSDLIHKVELTGFGGESSVSFDLIVPLSLEWKLPDTQAVVKKAQEQAQKHELARKWSGLAELGYDLLQTARTFDPHNSRLQPQLFAILLECLRRMYTAMELQKSEDREDENLGHHLEGVLNAARAFLRDRPEITSHFVNLAKVQAQQWNQVLEETLREPQSINEDTPPEFPRGFGMKDAHLLAMGRKQWDRDQGIPNGLFEPDAFGWYPIHYAAAATAADTSNHMFNSIGGLFSTRGRKTEGLCVRDLWGWTPLHYACLVGNEGGVSCLLRDSAEVNVVATDRVSPMHCAAKNGNIAVVKMLISPTRGKSVYDRGSPGYTKQTQIDLDGRHPIHWATVEGHAAVVELMVGDIDLPDRWGYTPLHLAARYKHVNLLAKLVELGANVGLTDERFRSPLHVAIDSNFSEGVDELLKCRELVAEAADVNKRGAHKTTALQMAIEPGAVPMVERFREAGADNWRALCMAVNRGYDEIAEKLRQAGAARCESTRRCRDCWKRAHDRKLQPYRREDSAR